MTRELYPGELVQLPDGKPAVGVVFSLWDSATGGSNITANVLAADGVSSYSSVTSSDGLLLPFTGPDNWRDPIFVDTGAAIRFMLPSSTVLDDIGELSVSSGFGGLIEDPTDPGFYLSVSNEISGLTYGSGASSGQAAANVTTINSYLTTLGASANGVAGGIAKLGKGIIKIQGRITVPAYVSLLGQGAHDVDAATKIVCTAVGDGVDVTGDAGDVGDFRVDGAGVANYPFKTLLGNGRIFKNIYVIGALLDNITIQKTQNSLFLRCTSEASVQDTWVLDLGCGGLDFINCSSNEAGQKSLEIKQSGSSPEVYATPSHITFHHCLFERSVGDFPVIDITAGFNIKFDQPVVHSARTTSVTNPLIKVSTSGTGPVVVEGGQLVATSSAAWVGIGIGNGAQAVNTGMTSFIATAYAFDVPSGARLNIIGVPLLSGGSALFTTGTPSDGDQTAYRDRKFNELVTRASIGAVALGTKVSGEAGERFRLQADGSLTWGSGSDFSFPLQLQRNSDGTALRVNGATTTTTAPGAGGAGALPATPAGYMRLNIAGTNRLIPYY